MNKQEPKYTPEELLWKMKMFINLKLMTLFREVHTAKDDDGELYDFPKKTIVEHILDCMTASKAEYEKFEEIVKRAQQNR